MLATNSFCIKGRNAYVRDLETGDIFVKYRSVLFRGEKPFLEIMFCAGVLEQTLEQTLNPKTETDCLFSENLIGAIFCTKSRLIVGKRTSHHPLNDKPKKQKLSWFVYFGVNVLSALIILYSFPQWSWRSFSYSVNRGWPSKKIFCILLILMNIWKTTVRTAVETWN